MENLPEGTTPHTTNIPNASAGRTRVFSGRSPQRIPCTWATILVRSVTG